MATDTNFTTVLPVRRVLLITAAVAALGACGGESQPILSDQRPVIDRVERTSAEAPEAIDVNLEPSVASTDTSNATVVSVATAPATTAAPVTTVAPTTTVATSATAAPTTTSAPSPTVLSPESVGATEFESFGLMVVTAVGDPLNVRSGPGVEHAVLGELAHRTGNIDVSHSVEIDFTTIWHLISIDGEELGWVHSGFLHTPVEIAGCVADANLLGGYVPVKDVASGDVDGDGLEDAVQAFQNTADPDDIWLSVEFGNGGTSITAVINGVAYHPAVTGISGVSNLTYLPSEPVGDEILFALGSGRRLPSTAC